MHGQNHIKIVTELDWLKRK